MKDSNTLLPDTLYRECMYHYNEVRNLDFVVNNAIPIPYFGDCSKYLNSNLKIVTAALNPSDAEFPKDGEPRFDISCDLENAAGLEKTLSEYFQRNPYTRWFSTFEPLLNGLDASYGGIMSQSLYPNTALHLDMCSPIATSPTWSGLDADSRNRLTGSGREIFENLIEALQPQIVIASVGWSHITSWSEEFSNGKSWPLLKSYKYTKDSILFRSPLKVYGKEISMKGNTKFLFINGTAANIPFGRFTTIRKFEVGKLLASKL